MAMTPAKMVMIAAAAAAPRRRLGERGRVSFIGVPG